MFKNLSNLKESRFKYEQKSYFIEDSSSASSTIDGYIEHIRHYLTSYQWTNNNNYRNNRNNNIQDKIKIKYPEFLWTTSLRDIDFKHLPEEILFNHYEGMDILTTKAGFVKLNADLKYFSLDKQEISPISFNLGESEEMFDFLDLFRIQAAVNILKIMYTKTISRPSIICPESIFVLAIQACTQYIHQYNTTQQFTDIIDNITSSCAADINNSTNNEVDMYLSMEYLGLFQTEWESILTTSAQLFEFYTVNTSYGSRSNSINGDQSFKYSLQDTVEHIHISLLLQKLQTVSPYLLSNNHTGNIWIIKAPNASQGKGIKLMRDITDIVQAERDLRGRIIQKYIERPLLYQPNLETLRNLNYNSNNSTNDNNAYKFDIRIWVLIISYSPLKVYIYKTVYGRICQQPYSITTSTLKDSLVHLTNYSIQKHINKSNKLTTIHSNKRMKSNSSRNESANDVLYLHHDEIIDIIERQNMTKKEQYIDIWVESIWPDIKKKIGSFIQASSNYINNTRMKSFEFLGVDVILDENLHSWILEFNMSPAIAYRNEEQNKIVKSMCESMLHILLSHHHLTKANNNSTLTTGDWEDLYTTTEQQYNDINSNNTMSSYISNNNSNKLHYLDSYKVAIVGKPIQRSDIDFLDTCFLKSEKQLIIQKWARKYLFFLRINLLKHQIVARRLQKYCELFLHRLHIWKYKRICSAIIIQCRVRSKFAYFILKQLKNERKRFLYVIKLQCFIRQKLAKCVFVNLQYQKCRKLSVIIIQKYVRWKIRYKKYIAYRRVKAVCYIQHYIRTIQWNRKVNLFIKRRNIAVIIRTYRVYRQHKGLIILRALKKWTERRKQFREYIRQIQRQQAKSVLYRFVLHWYRDFVFQKSCKIKVEGISSSDDTHHFIRDKMIIDNHTMNKQYTNNSTETSSSLSSSTFHKYSPIHSLLTTNELNSIIKYSDIHYQKSKSEQKPIIEIDMKRKDPGPEFLDLFVAKHSSFNNDLLETLEKIQRNRILEKDQQYVFENYADENPNIAADTNINTKRSHLPRKTKKNFSPYRVVKPAIQMFTTACTFSEPLLHSSNLTKQSTVRVKLKDAVRQSQDDSHLSSMLKLHIAPTENGGKSEFLFDWTGGMSAATAKTQPNERKRTSTKKKKAKQKTPSIAQHNSNPILYTVQSTHENVLINRGKPKRPVSAANMRSSTDMSHAVHQSSYEVSYSTVKTNNSHSHVVEASYSSYDPYNFEVMNNCGLDLYTDNTIEKVDESRASTSKRRQEGQQSTKFRELFLNRRHSLI